MALKQKENKTAFQNALQVPVQQRLTCRKMCIHSATQTGEQGLFKQIPITIARIRGCFLKFTVCLQYCILMQSNLTF